MALSAERLHDGHDARRRRSRVPSGGGIHLNTADVSARLAWPDDAPALTAVQRRAWAEEYSSLVAAEDALGSTQDHAERWSATLTHSPEARFRVLVALSGPHVEGYVVLHPSQDPDAGPGDGEIGELVVDPAHRRAGHGSRLLQAAVDTLRADGFTHSRMWLMSTDDVRRRFLTAAGWDADGAHRELEAPDATRVRQIRLHTDLR